MRKLIICISLIGAMQGIHGQDVIFGVKGGLNYASLIDNLEPDFGFEYKFGFQIGGFSKINVAEGLFIQPELLYSLQGVKYTIEFNSVQLPQDPVFGSSAVDVKVNESTIILPILLQYYLGERFSVEAGPQLDYLFSYTTKAEGFDSRTESESDVHFGLSFGIGFDFNDSMGIGLDYNYGFNRADSDFPSKIWKSIFRLNFEYRFN